MESELTTSKNTRGYYSFFIASIKGISQVVFIENVVSGILILAAISTISIELGIIALLSSFIGTFVGWIGGADRNLVEQGLFGYNSVLTGIALLLFMTGPSSWGVALFGAFIASILTASMMQLFKNIGIPILTFPFILLTWLLLLASYRLKSFTITSDLVPQDLSHWKLDISGSINWTNGFLSGIGQIFFLQSVLSGILLFIAVFWAGWKLGLYAVLGNIAALATAYLIGGEHTLIDMGLYGYNAILTVMAVGVVFKEGEHRYSPISALLATCLTVPLIGSIDTILLPYGLPAFTMPFVVATWFFLGARKIMPNV